MAAAAPESGEHPPEDEPMTFLEHLGELRTRLIRALLGCLPGMVIAWEYKERLLELLVQPLTTAWLQLGLGKPTIHFANPVDPFIAYMKIAATVGLLIASPWVFWQAWAFIAPGLYKREQMYGIWFALASSVCFAGGAYFGYMVVFPMGFETFLSMAGTLPSGVVKVEPTIMIDEYLGFATQMLLAFGTVFEVPVVVTFLAIAGLVNWKQLLNFGRWWILIASILAAILTPPDVGSQMMMMIPLVALYFLSVGIAYFVGPKPEPAPEPEAPATEEDA